jgi:hypothetical protein
VLITVGAAVRYVTFIIKFMLEIETEILIKHFHCNESLYLSVIQGDVATILVVHVIGNVKLNFGMMYFDFLFILFLCSMHIFSLIFPFCILFLLKFNSLGICSLCFFPPNSAGVHQEFSLMGGP